LADVPLSLCALTDGPSLKTSDNESSAASSNSSRTLALGPGLKLFGGSSFSIPKKSTLASLRPLLDKFGALENGSPAFAVLRWFCSTALAVALPPVAGVGVAAGLNANPGTFGFAFTLFLSLTITSFHPLACGKRPSALSNRIRQAVSRKGNLNQRPASRSSLIANSSDKSASYINNHCTVYSCAYIALIRHAYDFAIALPLARPSQR
jgi:hypothetical protein